MAATRARIVVAGSVASVPGHGGWTWVLLQYVLGLRALGHEVWWIDPVRPSSIQPAGAALSQSTNAAYFQDVVRAFDLEDAATLVLQDEPVATVGASLETLRMRVGGADVLINVSGALTAEALLGLASRRVYLDLDPGYTQLWSAVEQIDMNLDAHTDFVTVGPGLPQNPLLPSDGRRWHTTLQPVVLGCWPDAGGAPPALDAFTTVANWRGYGSVSYGGIFFGQKAHSFREFLTLPRRSGERFVLALAIHADERPDRSALETHGWHVVDPDAVAATPAAYRRFVQQSAAELGIAKSGYVKGRTGWFSDRSTCYLASGRPVVAQDTGFGRHLPVGEGLLVFASLEEAADAVARVRRDYRTHAAAARRIAEDHLASDRVLGRLLRELGVAG